MPPSSPPEQALLIGVSQYQHVSSLPQTEDVPGLRKVLVSPDHCAYPGERVATLEEGAATREAILAALDELRSQASAPGSRTLFYFSGHGARGPDGTSYLLPVDARKEDLAATAISARELSRRLDRCAGEVTVMLDCCFAGGMGDAIAASLDEVASFDAALCDTVGSRNRVLLAACRPYQGARVSRDAPHGQFTGYVIQGLYGKASTDGLGVTVQQLFDYVQKHIVCWGRDAQHASFIASTEQFYSLTRYPAPIPKSVVFEKDVYLAYDRSDETVQYWIERTFQPELERNGCSVWDYDSIGELKLDFKEAIAKSKYVVVLLTPGYLRSRLDELKTTIAIMQSLHTRTPRFIPVQRERCSIPGDIGAFEGLDLTDANIMQHKRSMERLIKRLKKEPHLR
jgi:Caspase domain/TIR domain